MRHLVFFDSQKLQSAVSYYDLPNLNDSEVTTLYYEVQNTLTSLNSQLSFYKNSTLTKQEESSYAKGCKKIKILKMFSSEIRTELERRFQKNHHLTDEEISELYNKRCHLVEKLTKSEKKFYKTFVEILKETYGEEMIENLQQKTQEKITEDTLKIGTRSLANFQNSR